MKTVLSLAAAGGAILMGASTDPAAAQSATWSLRQNAESCYISRSFDVAGSDVDLTIQSFGPETPDHFILSGKGLLLLKQRARLVSVGMDETNDDARPMVALFGAAGDMPMIVFLEAFGPTRVTGSFWSGTPGEIALARAARPDAEALHFDADGMAPLTLPIGPMQAEYARLHDCVQALHAKWSEAASAGAHPVAEPELLPNRDTGWEMKYPYVLAVNRVSGVVQMRMTVDATGRVRECVVQRSTWNADFGKAACDSYKHYATFRPAKDAAGKAVPALYRTSSAFIVLNM